jgi:hypothetical protein
MNDALWGAYANSQESDDLILEKAPKEEPQNQPKKEQERPQIYSQKQKKPKRLLITLLSAAVIIAGTVAAIKYAQGYRPTTTGVLQPTGLLVANSFPVGAQVYINGKLTTATDNTLHLDPGTYEVEIRKDGFTSWHKKLEIQKELVTQTNALLIPAAPSLTPLTLTGTMNVTPSPDGQKIAFFVASASAETKRGLYVLELSDSNPLSLQKGPKQIARTTAKFNLEKAELLWSPDSSQLLMATEDLTLLLDPTKFNELEEITDISLTLKKTLAEWEHEMYTRERIRLSAFPVQIQEIATTSAKNLYFSPDEKKLLYTATRSVQIDEKLLPNEVLSASTQPQERTLEPDGMYVYDLTEDRNFRVGTENDLVYAPYSVPVLAIDLFRDKPLSLEASPSAFTRLQVIEYLSDGFDPSALLMATSAADIKTDVDAKIKTEIAKKTAQPKVSPSPLPSAKSEEQKEASLPDILRQFRLHYSAAMAGGLQWLPDSRHLLSIKQGKIILKEYDSTNETIAYSGPFVEPFVYPWPDGSRLIILANFNQGIDGSTNLYAVVLR